MELLPNSITLFDLFLLILFCFIGAAISTSIGTGGGLVVIGAMSLVIPVTALLSIHAIIQSGSGILRAIMFRNSFYKKFFFLFMFGTLFGYFFATQFLIVLPEYFLKLFLGLGIIILTLIPNFKIDNISNSKIIIFGAITGFLTMFVGVMGPLLGIFLSSFLTNRHIIVGTLAWCISFQNLGKAIIFGGLGFDYTPWINLILILIVFSYFGTLFGKKLLDKSNDELFKKIIKIVIILLGGKLVIESILLMLK
ncbi:sulfite exporter TauE/SafE family protein [bacterium]|jgi:uncharacterized protein|nr:sulfite exporter TauE/SafE family protein [bacterium]